MADQIQRVNYFKNQFLHVEDFTAEQSYHLDMRRRHNRWLHSWGIAEGLKLSFAPNGSAVTVSEGMAIDNQGREIVLVDDDTLELADFEGGRDVWVTIAYGEAPTREQNETGVKGNTRVEERPELVGLLAKPAEGTRIVLGRVTRGGDNGTQITEVDSTVRTIAGAIEGDVLLTPRDPAVPADDYVSLKWAGAKQADLVGNLRVRKFAPTTPDGNVTVEGNVGIGTGAQPASVPLEVRGPARLGSLAFVDAPGPNLLPDAWVGMANNIEGATRWLHIGGITDAGARRLALFADRVYVSGSVGLGTPAPSNRLHVADNTGIRQNRLFLSGGGGSGWSSLSFNAHHNAANNAWAFIEPGATAVTLEMDASAGFPRFDVYATTAAAPQTWVHRFRIDGNTGMTALAPSGGNVGIGITNPANRLDVAGGGALLRGWTAPPGGTPGLTLGFDPANGGGSGVVYATGAAGSTRLWLDGNPIIFAPGGAERGRLDSAGNLTISGGLSIPARALLAINVGQPAAAQQIVGGLGFVGYGVQHGQLSFRAGRGFEFVDRSADLPDLNYAFDSREYADVHARMLRLRRGWGNWLELWKSDVTPNTGWIFHTTAPGNNRLYIGYSPNAGASVDWQYWLDPATGNAKLNNAAVGQVGHGVTWAGFGHADTADANGYAVLQSNDGRWTLINARAFGQSFEGGGGRTEFRFNNVAKARIDEYGRLGTNGYTPTPLHGGWGGGIRTFDLEAHGTIWCQNNVYVDGTLVAPRKAGAVVDQFVNNLGAALEQGDVVILGENQSSLRWGGNHNIPIPEVDTTETAYDTRVCGVVAEAVAEVVERTVEEADVEAHARRRKSKPETVQEARLFTPEEREEMEQTVVQPGQIGTFITLGAMGVCKVDADVAPIAIGDLLTTSPTRGHAQKAEDPACGSILGKALGALDKGKGTIPVLVTLH